VERVPAGLSPDRSPRAIDPDPYLFSRIAPVWFAPPVDFTTNRVGFAASVGNPRSSLIAEAGRFTVFAMSPLWVRWAFEGASLRRDQAAAVASKAQSFNNWLPTGRPVDFV
jgi:hypothetical protein